jgi:Tol biopolymer transport system component
MTRLHLFLLYCVCLLVGCGVEEERVTAVSPMPSTPATETAVLPTPTQPPVTDTPMGMETAVLTNTPDLTSAYTYTPQPSIMPTSAPIATLDPSIATDTTLRPFIEGQLIFIWNPSPKPSPEEMGPGEFPTSNMYRALPGETPDSWTIQPILTDLRIGESFIAPDRKKVALYLLEDTNADGTFRIESDVYKLYIYHFGTDLLEQVVDNMGFTVRLSWLPDSQAIIAPQDTNISFITLDGSSAQALTNQGPYPPDGLVFNPVVSPDGKLLAITLLSGVALSTNTITLFDLEDRAFKPLADLADVATLYISISWSPNSEWLAFTNGSNRGLSIVNTKTTDVMELSSGETRCFPAWSSIGLQLAYTCGGTLSLWNANSQMTESLASAEAVGPPVWSPTGDFIATSFVEDGRTGLWITEPISNSKQVIDLSTTAKPVIWSPIIWSPDGEWLLFLSEKGNQSGYYIINRLGGEPYLVLDTTGLFLPHDFVWLSNDVKP